MQNGQTRHYEIPPRIRSVVYLVGMLGFPVVVASYVLVVLSGDLRTVDKRITELGSRIDERPMGLDKTTDFAIYVTSSLHQELKAGLTDLADDITFHTTADPDSLVRDVNRIDRQLESYIRPIVRQHQRFAERFPSVGGNLGSMFVLSAPSEDISRGDTEGYLTGETQKDFGESLSALLYNNIIDFGPPILEAYRDGSYSVEMMNGDEFEIMSKELFVELSVNAINTAVTALRDQMLVKVRLQSSELDDRDWTQPKVSSNDAGLSQSIEQ